MMKKMEVVLAHMAEYLLLYKRNEGEDWRPKCSNGTVANQVLLTTDRFRQESQAQSLPHAHKPS